MGVGHSVGGEQTDAGCPVFYGYVDGFAQFFRALNHDSPGSGSRALLAGLGANE